MQHRGCSILRIRTRRSCHRLCITSVPNSSAYINKIGRAPKNSCITLCLSGWAVLCDGRSIWYQRLEPQSPLCCEMSASHESTANNKEMVLGEQHISLDCSRNQTLFAPQGYSVRCRPSKLGRQGLTYLESIVPSDPDSQHLHDLHGRFRTSGHHRCGVPCLKSNHVGASKALEPRKCGSKNDDVEFIASQSSAVR